jgi:hypothetical protein
VKLLQDLFLLITPPNLFAHPLRPGQTAFVIISDNKEGESWKQEVVQPTLKVAQPETETNIEPSLSPRIFN